MTLFLNWIVQGSLLTLLVATGVRLCRSLNASTRESIWWLTIAAVVGLPIAGLFTAGDEGFLPPPPFAVPPSSFVEVPHEAAWWLPLLVGAWLTWFLVGGLRIVLGLRALRRAKRRATPLSAAHASRLPAWSRLAERGRPTRIVVSTDVHHAAVLGLGQPLIAVAPAMLEHLNDSELDEVVVHEYAHVQRRDDLAVLAQRFIWAVAGMHPAIWWLDRALTVEREVACDDWVVARARSPRPYAACLVKLAAGSFREGYSLVPRIGLSQALVTIRVSRLLDGQRNATTARSIRTILSGGLAIPGVATACLTTSFVAFAPHAPLPHVGPAALAHLFASQSPRDYRRPFPVESLPTGRPSPVHSLPAADAKFFHADRAPAPAAEAPRTLERRSASDASIQDVTNQPTAVASILDPLPARAWPAAAIANVAPLAGDARAQSSADPSDRSTYPRTANAWSAAASFGVALGNSSRDAAVKTAGFFSRAGKSIGGAF
jgi:Zn-dependent protease with chaperone function